MINLIENWNTNNNNNSKNIDKNKKRSYSSTILNENKNDNENNEMPIKRSKINNEGILQKNCLIDLEIEAKKIMNKVVTDCIQLKYNVNLTEKEQTNLIYNSMSKPKKGFGEISIPCFRFTKKLNIKNPKQVI